MDYYFIVNPNAGSGKGQKVWEKVEDELAELEFAYHCYVTTGPGQCMVYVHELTAGLVGEATLVVIGGDGTLNEVINGIVNPKQVILAFIPTGSSNDFARGTGIVNKPVERLHQILAPSSVITADIGEVKAPGQPSRKFVVSCGIGFDAVVTDHSVKSASKDWLNKIRLGKLTYLNTALRELMKFKRTDAVLHLDSGEKIKLGKLYFISSHILPYEGGGFRFAPEASQQDGELDMCTARRMSKPKVILLLPTAFMGKHDYFNGIDLFRSGKVRIRTRDVLAVHTDGETYGYYDKISVRCLTGWIRMIAE